MRPAVQEQKAVLCLQLHVLCRKPPEEVASGSIQTTRLWVSRRRAAKSVKRDPRASVRQLREAIDLMRQPLGGRAS